MKLDWTDWAVVTALAGAGCAALYAGLVHAIRRAVEERQRETERKLSALAATVKALQARVAELGRQQAERARETEAAAGASADENQAGPEQEPAKPEILAAITAAATAFLGKKARIRSAKLVPAEQGTAGAWAQQGRVIVQTSHNLRSRG